MSIRPTTVMVVVAALVVALAVVAAVVSSGRDRPTLDASTPEGVVQLYVRALFDDVVATTRTSPCDARTPRGSSPATRGPSTGAREVKP